MKNSYVCSHCGTTVTCSQSYYRVLSKRNPDLVCRKCNLRGGLDAHKAKYNITEYGRDCKTCGKHLPWIMFPGNGLTKARSKNPNCKDCLNASFKTKWGSDADFREKTRKTNKASHLKRTYGISISDYEAMVAANNGRCAICSEEADLCVDHCHDTGRIRGLLCRSCNKALGIFKDSPDLLAAAKEYLHKYAKI